MFQECFSNRIGIIKRVIQREKIEIKRLIELHKADLSKIVEEGLRMKMKTFTNKDKELVEVHRDMVKW